MGDAYLFLFLFLCVQPKETQQTILKSFTLGGVGLHSGEYGEFQGALGCCLKCCTGCNV